MQKAACLCLALIAASLLAVPVVMLAAWAVEVTGTPGWVAVVVFHAALAYGAVALYRRWLPRMTGRGNAEAG